MLAGDDAVPSAVNATARTHPSWPFRTRRQRPDSSSQTRTVSSAPPVATRPAPGVERDRAHLALVARELPQRLPGGHVPDPREPSP